MPIIYLEFHTIIIYIVSAASTIAFSSFLRLHVSRNSKNYSKLSGILIFPPLLLIHRIKVEGNNVTTPLCFCHVFWYLVCSLLSHPSSRSSSTPRASLGVCKGHHSYARPEILRFNGNPRRYLIPPTHHAEK